MANIIAKDGAGDTKYIKATGTGTNIDPFISDHYISSIAAGDNNIGNVDVASIAAGTSLIGKVSIDQVTANANEVVVKSALPAGTNAIGKLSANSGVDIGDVDVLSMPVTHIIADSGTIGAVTAITNALPAGDNNIGNVDIITLPADPFGTNADVAVVTDASGSISSKLRGIIKLLVDKITVKLDTGTNIIGKVSIDQSTANANEVVIKSGVVTSVTSITNALPAGTNAIGKLSANSGIDIGDVDITSIAAGTNLIGKVSIDQVTANANEVVVKSGVITSITNALPAGTNAIGKLSANSGIDIGDVDVASIAAGENHLGAVGGNTVEVDSTPTLTVHASYASGDYVGTSATCITFANCARVNAGTGVIIGATLIDYAAQSVAAELWLFDASVTPPNDSAAWTISDADALKCIGVIPFSSYYASALNSVCNGTIPNGAIPYKSTGTALYGCIVTRGAPTYASGDVSIRLYVAQD